MFGKLQQFTKHLHKTSFNVLEFFAKNRTSKLQRDLGEEARILLFRSDHFASQKRTNHTVFSFFFQFPNPSTSFFSHIFVNFVKQGELKLDASSRSTRIASVRLGLLLHCKVVYSSVVRHSMYWTNPHTLVPRFSLTKMGRRCCGTRRDM